jgi:cobalt-precorrin-5B (C1)-methyltransferase
MTALRGGYTTGCFAAAAAKAALAILCGMPATESVEVSLPDGERVRFPIVSSQRNSDGAEAVVRKFAGDDPDVTDKACVAAAVRFIDGEEIVFAAGEGVGVVTKPGLALPPGEPAINPGPRKMIRAAVRELTSRGLRVTISIPGGRELAQRTFNPRLGIEGGLSVLGTTGRVRPFSAPALCEALKCALDVAKACGIVAPVLVPGNIGEHAARQNFSLRPEQVVQVSNQWGYMLDRAKEHGFERWLVLGHPGKLAKLVLGEWDTHSAHSSSAVPVVTQLATSLLNGPVLESATVEGIFEALAQPERARLADLLAARIRSAIRERVGLQQDLSVALINLGGNLTGSAGDLTPWR